MAQLRENMRRVFAIQEERQSQYHQLKKAQESYASPRLQSLQCYQQAVAEVTQNFTVLSQEVMGFIAEFRELGLNEVTAILEKIQQQEKEKLQLTVKWQTVLSEVSGEAGDGRGGDSGEEVEDFGTGEHQRKELKKRLFTVEGIIAELLQDFKFECEPYLLDTGSEETS